MTNYLLSELERRMSFAQSDVLQLNSLVDNYCHKHNQPIFGYDNAHVCTKDCTMLGTNPKYICVASRKLHMCGSNFCQHCYQTSEGTFCFLTGNELYGPEDNVSRIIVRDVNGTSTRHWGEEINGKGRKTRRPSKEIDFLRLFEKAIQLFLSSPERQDMYAYELSRYKLAIKRAAKKKCGAKIDFFDAVDIVRDIAEKHKSQCRAPVASTARWIPLLAQKIFSFWKQTSILITRKAVPSLTAVALSLLGKSDGYSRNGVVYVNPSSVIQQHSLTDMQFGKFNGLTCRRMSIVVRGLMKSLLTKDGQQRIIKPLEFGLP